MSYITFVIDGNEYTKDQVIGALTDAGGRADSIAKENFAEYAKSEFPEFFHVTRDAKGTAHVRIQTKDLRKEMDKKLEEIIRHAAKLRVDIKNRTEEPMGLFLLSEMASENYGTQMLSDYGAFSLNTWMYKALALADLNKKAKIEFTISQIFDCGPL